MYFVTNKCLARRTFLRGLGTTLALPLLESMLPARGALAAAKKIAACSICSPPTTRS
jgi:hypothetical protein